MQYYIENDYYNLPENSLFVTKLMNSIRKYAKREQKPVLYSTSEVIYPNLVNFLLGQNIVLSADLKSEAMLYTVRHLADTWDSSKNFFKNVGDIFIIDDKNLLSPVNLKTIKRKLQQNNGELHYQTTKEYFSSSLINFIDIDNDIFQISCSVLENKDVIKKISLIFPNTSPYMSVIMENGIEVQPFYNKSNYLELKPISDDSPFSLKLVRIMNGRGEKDTLEVDDLKTNSAPLKSSGTSVDNNDSRADIELFVKAINDFSVKLDNLLENQNSKKELIEAINGIHEELTDFIKNQENIVIDSSRNNDLLGDFRIDND